jgi:3-oxoadipate enol-lactonase
MLSNSLGTTLHMWDGQVAPLTRHFRLVRYDRRGHGQSGVPAGPYTMERLGHDVLAVLDALGIEKTSWCGLSMGGMVGQWLGANAPARIERLVLTNTSSYFPDKGAWNDRLRLVREKGIAAFAAANMERWFTKGFRERAPEVVARVQDMFAATPLEGYLACGEAVRDMTIASSCPGSARPPSSSPEGMTRRRLRRQTSTSANILQGRSSRSSTPRTSRTSSSPRLIPRPCWNSCLAGDQESGVRS